MSALLKAGIDGRGIKIKFAALVEAAGGLEPAALFCRVGKSMLHRYISTAIADGDCYAPIDVVRDLERLVGDPIVTRFLAAEADHALIARPRLASVTVDDVHLAIAACAKEHGDAMSRALESLADRRLSPAEAAATIREIDEVIDAQLTLRALLAQLAEVA